MVVDTDASDVVMWTLGYSDFQSGFANGMRTYQQTRLYR
ncbi:hypothetical protein SP41_128 [Salmonella phage 41]|nr:hypothetical protein SP41_128 [Salmonella phage 41]